MKRLGRRVSRETSRRGATRRPCSRCAGSCRRACWSTSAQRWASSLDARRRGTHGRAARPHGDRAAEPDRDRSCHEDGIERHLVDSLVALVLDVVRDGGLDRRSRERWGLSRGAAGDGAVRNVRSPWSRASARRPIGWHARRRICLTYGSWQNAQKRLRRRERERWSVATARALGAAAGRCVELAAPLVALGGTLVAWRGPA